MNRTFTVHSDPGHAWMEVEKKEIRDLGIQDKISAYSYKHGNSVYLEEDCDMPKFLEALRNHSPGIQINFKEVLQDESSGIRNMARFGGSDTL